MEIVTMRPITQPTTVTGWSKPSKRPPPTTPELSILDDDAEGSIDTVAVPKPPAAPVTLPVDKTCRRDTAPCRPRPASCMDDVDSSDDEEDYRQSFRRYFRPKSAMLSPLHDDDDERAALSAAISASASAIATATADLQHAKRGRSTRQNNSTKAVLKIVARAAPSELPFADAKNRKPVQLSASAEEIEDDLLEMQGRPKRRRAESAVGRGKMAGRKRRRTASSDGVSRDGSEAEGTDCKGSSSQSTAPVDQPQMAEKKKGRTEGKLFMKHGERKGWVVCRKCRAAVWPPNCAKHVANCMG